MNYADRPLTILVSPHIQAWKKPLPTQVSLISLPIALADNPNKIQFWVSNILTHLKPSAVWVDTFPCGIFGELKLPHNLPKTLLTRILKRPDSGFQIIKNTIHYEQALLAEPLSKEQYDFTETISDQTKKITWKLPKPIESPLSDTVVLTHSGSQSEVNRLIRELPKGDMLAAVNKDILLPAHYKRISDPKPFYPKARKIVSAAGFNTFLETKAFREKQTLIPFSRRFDDQALRIQLSLDKNQI